MCGTRWISAFHCSKNTDMHASPTPTILARSLLIICQVSWTFVTAGRSDTKVVEEPLQPSEDVLSKAFLVHGIEDNEIKVIPVNVWTFGRQRYIC
jgi:hypothetical protein